VHGRLVPVTSDDRVRLTIYANEYVKEATPEPQQADASPVLDLVRQYGDERQRMGSATFAASAPVVHEYKTRAAATLARIAALVPQQPVQARDEMGALLWINKEGCVSPGADDGDNAARLPLLVGGDPAPEPDLIKEFGAQFGSFLARQRASERSDRHEPHVDGPREPSAQERADHDLMAALGVEQIGEVIPAIEHLKALVDHLRNWRSEHDKRERERDEARAEVLEHLRTKLERGLALLDTVKSDRETIRGSLNYLKDTVTGPAIKLLGVQHNEDIVPAIERLKATQPDPRKLNLPALAEALDREAGL
jgi:hypothetical protein